MELKITILKGSKPESERNPEYFLLHVEPRLHIMNVCIYMYLYLHLCVQCMQLERIMKKGGSIAKEREDKGHNGLQVTQLQRENLPWGGKQKSRERGCAWATGKVVLDHARTTYSGSGWRMVNWACGLKRDSLSQ